MFRNWQRGPKAAFGNLKKNYLKDKTNAKSLQALQNCLGTKLYALGEFPTTENQTRTTHSGSMPLRYPQITSRIQFNSTLQKLQNSLFKLQSFPRGGRYNFFQSPFNEQYFYPQLVTLGSHAPLLLPKKRNDLVKNSTSNTLKHLPATVIT